MTDAAPITPLPTGVRSAARAGTPLIVFGGSFDPPHLGHMAIATNVRTLIDPTAWLLYIPAAQSPLKAVPGASEVQRLAMLSLALTDTPPTPEPAAIWTDEIDRAAWARDRHRDTSSYTVDTLTRLRTLIAPAAPVHLLLGADQAASLHRWCQPRTILALANPLIVLREPLATPAALHTALRSTNFWNQSEIARLVAATLTVPLHPASSTALRALAAQGRSLAKHPHLTPRVGAFIVQHGLYRPRALGTSSMPPNA